MKKSIIISSVISLLLIACTMVTTKRQEVLIERDAYGTPRITADTTYGLFYGYGYAVGQDRLFQMDMLKRTTQGKVSEVLGEHYLQLDITTQTSFNPDDIKQQINNLNVEQRNILQGYADGINAYLIKISANPKLMPAEYAHFGFQPQHWSAYDVAMMFVGSMNHRYADFNEELSNLEFLTSLTQQHGATKAWKIFDVTMPLYGDIDGNIEPFTVPFNRSSRERGNSGKRAPDYLEQLITPNSIDNRVLFNTDGSLFQASSDSDYRQYERHHFARSGTSGIAGFSAASNLWAVNGEKLIDADATLFNGPQFGWSNPGYVYGINLNGAGYAVQGNTLLAYPAHLFGHNDYIGWGSTAGFGDLVDIFQLQLNPDNHEQYWYKGKYVDLNKREIAIQVKGKDTHSQTVYRSHYGAVVKMDAGKHVAFSKRRSWEGNEVMNLIAWVELGKAKNFSEFKQHLAKMHANINFYYMDKKGNIGYVHGGKYPIRHAEHDNRLPVPGNGEYDWKGFQNFDDNPQVYNPPRGYLYNWNNRPEHNWPSSDLWWANWGIGHRARILDDALAEKQQFSSKEIWQLNQMASHQDINASYLLPKLYKALGNTDDNQAVAVLNQWNQSWIDSNADGYFDSPANLIMQQWLSDLLQYTLKDDIGFDFFYRFASTGYPIHKQVASLSMQPGTKIIVRQLYSNDILSYDFFNGQSPQQVLKQTFESSIASLKDKHGDDIAKWQQSTLPLSFVPYNFRGVPQAIADNVPELPVIMNRGSENNQFISRSGTISGIDVIPPSQSGFINKFDQPYPIGQLELYQCYQSKPLFSNSNQSVSSEVIYIVKPPKR